MWRYAYCGCRVIALTQNKKFLNAASYSTKTKLKLSKSHVTENPSFGDAARGLATARRSFSSKASEKHDDTTDSKSEENRQIPQEDLVNITFVTDEGEEIKVKAKVGDNVLKLGLDNDVGCEGACGGELSCTTCHMYVDESYYDLVEGPSLREEDLLDIAKFLKPNSRLVCQLNVTKEFEGMRLTLPPCTVNFYVDDYKPKPH